MNTEVPEPRIGEFLYFFYFLQTKIIKTDWYRDCH